MNGFVLETCTRQACVDVVKVVGQIKTEKLRINEIDGPFKIYVFDNGWPSF